MANLATANVSDAERRALDRFVAAAPSTTPPARGRLYVATVSVPSSALIATSIE
jgi:hypothetical protein